MKKLFLYMFFLIVSVSGFTQTKDPCDEEGDEEGDQGEDQKSLDIPVIRSFDPNEIVGPNAYDTTKKWVSLKSVLSYKILFENDPDFATAPAQNVTLYLPIQSKLNPNSFRLGDFGFGSFVFSVPPNSTSYTNRLDMIDSLGVLVDVTAGLDITNNRAFWVFQSIDPVTGLSSTLSPITGFLPINDTTRGNGEGFVTLTLQPVANAKTGDTTSATASIIFDDANAIATNSWRNTIDAIAPTSKVNLISPKDNNSVLVTWSGKDDIQGVGLKSYSLYISENDGPFAPYLINTDSTQVIFTGKKGNKYALFTRATDFTGNTEAAKQVADQTFIMGETLAFFFADTDNDGYGDRLNTIRADKAPPGFVTDSTDCNDDNPAIHGTPEICNGIDDNCDDQVDEGCISQPVALTTIKPAELISPANSHTNNSVTASITLIPNPASKIVNVYTTGLQKNKQTTISIISASGVIMKTQQANGSFTRSQLNISSMPGGVYTLKIVSGHKVLYSQFVKL